MTLLADLLGTDWWQPMPERFGMPIAELPRRQAEAAIRRFTRRVPPRMWRAGHVAPGGGGSRLERGGADYDNVGT